ncbi:hypothetical protein AJ79_09499 [Helicocarpus griseus UAMH5409]|uniref:MT-A70-domain-containing protein n=1 Tax=Helicocarpus griseus UAMH5409 TaxID=1447875 RepID=A0A2B7WJ51_9EURO|nr:hypothetical protein AJ79_09499 [Helicocarpus griseus UAMH5409]
MPKLPNHASSAILYQNATKTVILIDIPTSIGVAQRLRQLPQRAEQAIQDDGLVLVSCDPQKDPYPNPPEPKTDKARNSVLAQIPEPQQRFHEEIVPLINDALQEVKNNHQGNWCNPRRTRLANCVVAKESEEDLDNEINTSAKSDKELPQKRKRRESNTTTTEEGLEEPSFTVVEHESSLSNQPPVILAPGINRFSALSDTQGPIVQNPSYSQAVLNIKSDGQECTTESGLSHPNRISINVPPKSAFLNCHLIPGTETRQSPLTTLSSDLKFDFILMDPPWPNRSVRRSSHYKEHASPLQPLIEGILQNHMHPHKAIVAIWVTNSLKSRSATLDALKSSGLHPFEEWIWVKTTVDGQPVFPTDGLWRRPYEVLILAHKEGHVNQDSNTETKDNVCEIKRRIIVAVPDVHSRKPNLKELIEDLFFSSPTSSGQSSEDEGKNVIRAYSGLEVFARNLTAGWWACGDEVVRFNWEGWWDRKVRDGDAA